MIKVSFREWFTNFNNSITASLGMIKPLTLKRASQLFLMRGKLDLDTRSKNYFLTEDSALQKGERENIDILAETHAEKMRWNHYPFYRLLSLRQSMYAAIDRMTTKKNSLAKKSNIPAMLLKGALATLLFVPELIAFSMAKIPDIKPDVAVELQQPLLSRQDSSSSSEISSVSITTSLNSKPSELLSKNGKNPQKIPNKSEKKVLKGNASFFINFSKMLLRKKPSDDFSSAAEKKLKILQDVKTKVQYVKEESIYAKDSGKKPKFVSYTFKDNVSEKVSERDQIKLDELLAKKLQNEINKKNR